MTDKQKDQVRYWSKIGALTLTLVPPIIKLSTKEAPWNKPDWKQLSLKEKSVIIGLLILLGVITYYACYCTISSIFWPESLSIMNWILLVPSSVWLFMEVKGLIENTKLLTKTNL